MSRPVVGFVGVGVMGAPMAGRLLDAGFPLRVWSRNPARTEFLVARGAEAAPDPAGLAAGCDIVVGCLLDSAAVSDVYRGPRGILAGARPGTVVVEHGTFDPALAVELALDAAAVGVAFVDAPVSGGRVAAEAGTLIAMAGGDVDAVDRIRPVTAVYTDGVERVGPAGSGLHLKLVNQLLVTTHVVAAGEAAAMVRRAGVDAETARRVLGHGWGASAMLDRCLPLALAEGPRLDSDAPLGGLAEAQELIARTAAAAGLDLPLFEHAASRFAEATGRGWQRRDLAAIADLSTPGTETS